MSSESTLASAPSSHVTLIQEKEALHPNTPMAIPNSTTYIVQVICLYWVVSISMVYLNKILVASPDVSIPAPIFITFFQVTNIYIIGIVVIKMTKSCNNLFFLKCLTTSIICIFLGELGHRDRSKR